MATIDQQGTLQPKYAASLATAQRIGGLELASAKLSPDMDWGTERHDQMSFHGVSRMTLTTVPLMLADMVAVSLAAGIGYGISQTWWQGPQMSFINYAAALIVSTLIAKFMFGLYPGVGLSPSVELKLTTLANCVVYVVFLASSLLQQGTLQIGLTGMLITTWAMALAAVPLVGWTARGFLSRLNWWGEPVLIFGQGPQARAIYQYFRARPGMGLRPRGMLGHKLDVEGNFPPEMLFAPPEKAAELARRHGISWAIIASGDLSKNQVLRCCELCATAIPNRLVMTDLEHFPSLWNRTHDCGGTPGIQVTEKLLLPVPRFIKRAMDLLLTILAAGLLAPLLATLAILVKYSSPGPIFYGHTRIGRNGKKFKAWKFRSMIPQADQVLRDYLAKNPEARAEYEATQKLRHDPRITRVGNFLRKTSLDELPQLWNVLRGQMSLVGPRPIVDDEVCRYAEEYRHYLRVRPGITGLWQVSGRSLTTYEERVRLDTHYVRNWSPWLDLYILVRTIKTVLLREGAF
ncbi:MAG: undecaprenyl-phosphate galactose phosphotransferase WbaP [Pirellulales bacterium]|nr:undecaprenyl-phosphate galactose phosphotransferase WbaP [Pirellulales bacterium]